MELNSLKALGFNEKQIQLYMIILQAGKVKPADLAVQSGINRTTVYSIAKELIKMGVIAEDQSSEGQYLIALPPEDLEKIIHREEKALEVKKASLQTALKEIKKVAQGTKYHVPKVTFISEEDLEHHLYKQAPIWTESAKKYDSIWWGYQDPSFSEHYERWIDWYWTTGPGAKDVSLKMLTNQSGIEEIMKKKKYINRKTKFWDKTKDFTATTWIVGDYIIYIYADKRPHYMVEIYDAPLAKNQREIFKGLWDMVKEVK
ncbi:MAG: helix-turn-helix domain-containing protein [Janthinobacterium sp.]|jgi:predicted transcriptional regulator